MKPGRQSIAQMSENEDYEFVATEYRQVYPGWCTLHVYSDANGVLWGANEYMSDDTSTGEEPTDWYRVYPKPEVKYYFHEELPEVIEKRHKEYEDECKRRETEREVYEAPEAKRERSTEARTKLRATLARMQSDDPTPKPRYTQTNPRKWPEKDRRNPPRGGRRSKDKRKRKRPAGGMSGDQGSDE